MRAPLAGLATGLLLLLASTFNFVHRPPDRLAKEITGDHTTLFQSRGKDDFKPTPRQRFRKLMSDLVPPIVARRFHRS